MSNVTLSIGGREYRVACAEGEEGHVAHLGRLIDEKVSQMDGGATQSENRLLLFASLLLADEVHELKQAAQSGDGSDAPPPPDASLKLEAIAEKLENLAVSLESDVVSP